MEMIFTIERKERESTMPNVYEEALKLHAQSKGKLEIKCKVACENAEDLSLAYSPGVAQPCLEIEKDPETAYLYTGKGNTIAVITDGTAVLGLGDIGPTAALPVMEGKALLLKKFGHVDAYPICLDTKNVEEIIQTCKFLSPGLGGINLEDISAPRCVEIERRLIKELNIPVFHDDQHGTAIVVLAALINSMKLTKKNPAECKVVVSGCGAAGSSIIKMLYRYGFTNIYAFDVNGSLSKSQSADYDFLKQELLEFVNLKDEQVSSLGEALIHADVFVGVSVGNIVTPEMVQSMNDQPIIMAMANPTPEIAYDTAKAAGAFIVGTGRSDYPNQVNNLLAFPGIFRGALDAKATKIDEDAKMAASVAIASLIGENELNENYIIPSPFDPRVSSAVAMAVAKACVESGNIRK